MSLFMSSSLSGRVCPNRILLFAFCLVGLDLIIITTIEELFSLSLFLCVSFEYVLRVQLCICIHHTCAYHGKH